MNCEMEVATLANIEIKDFLIEAYKFKMEISDILSYKMKI